MDRKGDVEMNEASWKCVHRVVATEPPAERALSALETISADNNCPFGPIVLWDI